MKEIARGAEAVIYLDKNKIIKHRIPKSYRIKEIDENLRKKRIRSEAKILEKITIPHPKLISFDEKKATIEMEFINGDKLRDVFDIKHTKKIGEYVAKMHNEGIVHGDLTTSNMIEYKNEIYFIDFGLSFFSNRFEDKAVDLHLLKEALESKHYKIADKAFKQILTIYKKHSKDSKEILERLKLVEERGRHKHK